MSAIDRQTQILEKTLTSAEAQRVSSIQEDLFIQGKSFSSRHIVVSPTEAPSYIDLVIDARDCDCSQIVFAPLRFVADEGPIVVELRVGCTVSALGTELGTFNRRATSSNVSHLKVYHTPTVTGAGTVFSEILVPSSALGVNIRGAQSAAGLPFEINKELLYIARIKNNNGTNANVEYNATWFEI